MSEEKPTPKVDALVELCETDRAPKCSKDGFYFADGKVDAHDPSVLGSFFDLASQLERQNAELLAALQKCYWQLRGDADRADFMSDEAAEVVRAAQAAIARALG